MNNKTTEFEKNSMSMPVTGVDCLFLYRTFKKRQYFRQLARYSLEGHRTDVRYYHFLPRRRDPIRVPEDVLTQLLEGAEREVFNARQGLLQAALRRLFRVVRKAQIQKIYSRLFYYLGEKQPQVIVIWNGHKFQDLVLHEVNRFFGIPILYFENGLLPNSTTADFKGINARNSVPLDPEFYRSLPARELSQRNIVGRSYSASVAVQRDLSTLPLDYILVPFQKERDSQILDNSRWIQSMMQMVQAIVKAMADLPKPMPVVLREHPSSKSKLTELKRYVATIPWMEFDQKQPLKDVIERAQAVLTINSTVGLEGLLLNKKVIVLGDACYRIPGMVLAADDEKQLANCFQQLPKFEPDLTIKQRFFEYLEHDYIVEHDWKKMLHIEAGPALSEDQQQHFSAIAQKLLPTLSDQNRAYSFTKILTEHKPLFNAWDGVLEYAQKFIARWSSPDTLPVMTNHSATETVKAIEIVSHCWRYPHFLYHQLNSILHNPPQHVHLIVTIFYCDEDKETTELLQRVQAQVRENVTWHFLPLAKTSLFRRSIGRNLASLKTQADWIWFTDCDVVFDQNCFDDLAKALPAVQSHLVYPAYEFRSIPLAADHPWLHPNLHDLDNWSLDSSQFLRTELNRATGPMQITRGDIARELGYCRSIRLFQKPSDHWRKANEDRIFRQQFQGHTEAVKVGGVLRIQHQEKGRYQRNGFTLLRKLAQHIKMKQWRRETNKQ